MKEEKTLGAYFKSISNALDRKFNRDLDQFDLTLSQASTLMFLHFNQDKEISQIDIQNNFNLTNPTVTGILKRLELKGFICRTTSSSDGRRNIIRLTEKSAQLEQLLAQGIANAENQMTNGFTEEEKELLISLLGRVLVNIS